VRHTGARSSSSYPGAVTFMPSGSATKIRRCQRRAPVLQVRFAWTTT
jgi:uncharacterized protein YraI